MPANRCWLPQSRNTLDDKIQQEEAANAATDIFPSILLMAVIFWTQQVNILP